MKKVILFFALMAGVSFFVSAQSTPNVAKSQINQSARITQCVANGELTRKETRLLKKQQKHIRAEKRLAKADGIVTRREKAHIRHEQKVANRSIYHQKHDRQGRVY